MGQGGILRAREGRGKSWGGDRLQVGRDTYPDAFCRDLSFVKTVTIRGQLEDTIPKKAVTHILECFLVPPRL